MLKNLNCQIMCILFLLSFFIVQASEEKSKRARERHSSISTQNSDSTEDLSKPLLESQDAKLIQQSDFPVMNNVKNNHIVESRSSLLELLDVSKSERDKAIEKIEDVIKKQYQPDPYFDYSAYLLEKNENIELFLWQHSPAQPKTFLSYCSSFFYSSKKFKIQSFPIKKASITIQTADCLTQKNLELKKQAHLLIQQLKAEKK